MNFLQKLLPSSRTDFLEMSDKIANLKFIPPIALGAGAGAAATFGVPQDAEGAVRPDILEVIQNALGGKKYSGKLAGTLESPSATEALSSSWKYGGNNGYFTDHGLTWRNAQDGWPPEQIAGAYKGIYNSQDTTVIPNVLGLNPQAQEALWKPAEKGKSLYMPIVPHRKGFKGITLYDPDSTKVERLLKDRGYWEGGSISSIFTPSLEEGLAELVGSGTLSAVNNRKSYGLNLGDLLKDVKAYPWLAGSGAGAAATFGAPEDAEGAAIPGFAQKYADAIFQRQRGLLEAGSLEPDVFAKVEAREPAVTNNRVLVGTHGGDARYATGEMDPLESGKWIEDILNSNNTDVMPNFPSANRRDGAAKSMLHLYNGKHVVAPYMGGRDGDIILKTLFEPGKNNQIFIDSYLGSRHPSISGLRNNVSPSAQPQLSVVKQEPTWGKDATSGKKVNLYPWLAGSGAGAAATFGLPNEDQGSQSPIPWEQTEEYKDIVRNEPVQKAAWSPLDLFAAPVGVAGSAAKAAAMALDMPLTLGMDYGVNKLGDFLEWLKKKPLDDENGRFGE